MYEFANIAFFFLHTLMILFNMFGWAWSRTRVWHLVSMGLTSFSWFVLGFWRGWGYCLCTDWHMQVRRKLGYIDLDRSYVQLLSRHMMGLELSPSSADIIAGSVFLGILIATTTVWGMVLWNRPKQDRARV